MQGKRILLCVTGGIAAYKAIELASMLSKDGFLVRTVLTDSAKEFISPINFAAITHQSVHSSLWEDSDPIPHINLADWADLVVVAPATANTIAKAARGIADNLLGNILLAHTKPVLWVPAMNVHMYESPITQKNISRLLEKGDYVLKPQIGHLACGYNGQGKYPPNVDVVHAIKCYLGHKQDLIGKKVLITAGGTVEYIDPMRTIGNRSTGKMGIALARALSLRGAELSLVYANISVDIPYHLYEAIAVNTVDEMYEVVMNLAKGKDWIIKCAAVSDYKPVQSSSHKIKKGSQLQLELQPTIDILAELGKIKDSGQKLIGFAAETEDLAENARAKLKRKNLDLIVANHLDNAAQDTNNIHIIDGTGTSTEPLEGDKNLLAHIIIDRIIKL